MDWKEFEDFLRQTIEENLISRSRYFFVWKDLYKINIVNVEKETEKQREENKKRKHLLMQLWKPYWEYGKWTPNKTK